MFYVRGLISVPALHCAGNRSQFNTINLIEEQCNKNNGAGEIPDNIKSTISEH